MKRHGLPAGRRKGPAIPARTTLCLLGLVTLVLAGQAEATAVHAATLIVNSTADSVDANPGDGVCETATGGGVCTLRAAIQEANALPGDDVISLPAETHMLALEGADEDLGATGDLDIVAGHGNLIVVGAGAATTIIDGAQIDRVLHVRGPISVELSGLTIRNGCACSSAFGARDFGGGILNEGADLTLTGVAVSGNRARQSAGGIDNAGTLSLTDSTVAGNRAEGYGGGIFNSLGATATLSGATVDGNEAGFSGGGISNGGAVTLTGGTLAGNRARSSGGGLLNLNGGGSSAIATLSSVTVRDNEAAAGGGVHNTGLGRGEATLALTDVTISGNRAHSGGGLANVGYGGVATAILRGSTVSGNRASDLGGGIANASTHGGLGTATLEDTVVANNDGGDCAGVITAAGHDRENSTCGYDALTGLAWFAEARGGGRGQSS